MIEIKLKIDNVNYDEAVALLFPIISDKLEEKLISTNKAAGILGMLMNKSREFNMNVVKGILNTMTDEKKEELILRCVEGREEDVANMLSEMIYEKGLSLNINEFTMEKA